MSGGDPVSELEVRGAQPDPAAIVEYQLVRLNGTVLVSFLSPLGHAIYWAPAPGMEIWDACAARYRIAPDGPWIVCAYYPDGYPGPQGPWPEDAGLPGPRAMLTG
jgi:hypothetical protein